MWLYTDGGAATATCVEYLHGPTAAPSTYGTMSYICPTDNLFIKVFNLRTDTSNPMTSVHGDIHFMMSDCSSD